MAENIIKNPFSECTARDMSYAEVHQYWCNPFLLYDISEDELLTCRTPIVIEGIRGTGKTMIMKYLSYFVQKKSCTDRSMESKLDYFRDRSVGIYFRYKDDFCNLIDKLNCTDQDKERIFIHYYELFIIRQILEILEDFYCDYDDSMIEKVLCSFFAVENMSINEIRQHVNRMCKEMDRVINSSIYDDDWRDKIMPLIGSQGMIVDLIRTINHSVPGWKDILFVILLDEYENLGMFQTMVNTLIKQVDDTVSLTYRLGMRPAGMDKNNRTNVAGEALQVDRDFLLRPLEYKEDKDYREFAISISKKRLESIDVFRENRLCDIVSILGEKEDFDAEAKAIVKGKKHFKVLKTYFPDKDLMQVVINSLSCDEKLMEMYNILRVMRGGDYEETSALSQKYRELRDNKDLSDYIKNNTGEAKKLKKYNHDYSNKYRVTLLYILLTIYGEHKQHYSFNTFLKLSSGSINDFISLCRNTFKHMNSTMLEELKKGQSVSSRIQNYAAIDTAEDQRRKVFMSNKNGNKMYTFIDNMGSIFELYHRDLSAKYPETNQFAFADENEIRNDNQLNEYLIDLINSGAIIRKKNRQLISFGNTTRGYLYLLNRIFAPIYQYSYRTRGGFNQVISKNDFDVMLHRTINPNDYAKGIEEDFQQMNLYDHIEEDEDDPTDF